MTNNAGNAPWEEKREAAMNKPKAGTPNATKQVPEQTISDECKWCAEGEPEWSPYTKCWIHRRPSVDKQCLRRTIGPVGEPVMAKASSPAIPHFYEQEEVSRDE